MTTPTPSRPDIALRGSGELLHQIKGQNLSPADAKAYASLLVAVDEMGHVHGPPCSPSVERLIALKFCARVSPSLLMLNPHVAQLGATPSERGQLRKAFRQLVGA